MLENDNLSQSYIIFLKYFDCVLLVVFDYMLFLQQVAIKNLTERNKEMERQLKGAPSGNKIHLPFALINTHKDTVIDCQISGDKYVLSIVIHFFN